MKVDWEYIQKIADEDFKDSYYGIDLQNELCKAVIEIKNKLDL